MVNNIDDDTAITQEVMLVSYVEATFSPDREDYPCFNPLTRLSAHAYVFLSLTRP